MARYRVTNVTSPVEGLRLAESGKILGNAESVIVNVLTQGIKNLEAAGKVTTQLLSGGERETWEGIPVKAQTTDANPVVAASLETANNKSYIAKAMVVGRRSGGGALQAQIEEWDFAGLAGSDFDVVGAAKKLNLAAGLGYLWFNVTDGGNSQTDPTGTGTSVQVDVLAADDATALADKADAALLAAGITGVDTIDSTAGVLQVTYDAGDIAPDGDAGDSGTAFTKTQDGTGGAANDSFAYNLNYFIKNNAGSLTVTEMSRDETEDDAAAQAVLVANGIKADLQVTGEANDTIEWAGELEFYEA